MKTRVRFFVLMDDTTSVIKREIEIKLALATVTGGTSDPQSAILSVIVRQFLT